MLLAHFTPRPRATRQTTEHHLGALARVGGADVVSYNAVHGLPSWLRRLRFDAVVLHTTFLGMRWSPLFEPWRRRSDWLAGLACAKIAFPQDEYWHAGTLDAWLDDLGVSVVCTVLDETRRDELYPRLHGRAAFYEVLTGYIDEGAAERIRPTLRPLADRPHDVVYRARHLPYWLGSHGQLKHRIGEAVAERAPAHGLSCDISTRLHETILGDAWLRFLARGRATVGAESGSSTLDRHGELQAEVERLVAEQPDATFEEVDARMPPGWDDYRFFAISPRHLEAVATKTAQILVEGRYGGVLEPGRHYIAVRRDLSDLDEALEQLREPRALDDLVERAYQDVYLSGRYSGRELTATLERILDAHAPRRDRPRGAVVLARRVAAAEEEVERLAVAPLTNVVRSGRDGYREVLAGARLLATDPHARRLLADYAVSTEAREHVSPRVALADLLCLGAIRRARADDADFRIDAEVDEAGRRFVLRSRPRSSADAAALPCEQLEDLLRSGAWDFVWDHSGDGSEIVFPLAGNWSLPLLVPAGRRRLTTLDWLARDHPRDVASALAALLR